MVLKSFAHWLLWLVAGGLLLVGLIGAAAIGLFGTEVHDAISALFEPVVEATLSNSDRLVLVAKFGGALVTIVTGLFGLHKAWYYAERQLPKRLEEYIQNTRNQEIVGARNTFLNELELSGEAFNLTNLTRHREMVEVKLSVLNPALKSWQKQQATIDLVEGQHRSLKAKKLYVQGEEHLAHGLSKEAIKHFLKAAEADPEDLRAWKFAAEQAEQIRDYDQANEAWERIATAHERRDEPLARSRALIQQARALYSKSEVEGIAAGIRNGLKSEVKNILDSVFNLVTESTGPEIEKTGMVAETCELLGCVRTELETYHLAATRLNQAFEAFSKLQDSAGMDRVIELSEELREVAPHVELIAARSPEMLVAYTYERLGMAFVRNLGAPQARPKAIRALRNALGHYEEVQPRPMADIERVESVLRTLNN